MKTKIKKSVILLICSIFFLANAACADKVENQTDMTVLTESFSSAIPKAAESSEAVDIHLNTSNYVSRRTKIDENWTVLKYNNGQLYVEYTKGDEKISKAFSHSVGWPSEVVKIKNTLIAAFYLGGTGHFNVFYAINYDEASNSIVSECFEGCSFSVQIKDGYKGGITLNGIEYEGEFAENVKENERNMGSIYTYDGMLTSPREVKNIEKSYYSYIITDGNLIKTIRKVNVETGYMQFGVVEMIYNVEDDGSITSLPPEFYTLDEMATMSWRMLTE